MAPASAAGPGHGSGRRAGGGVHDPLWLLGRQWQLGELLGEDTGFPVAVRVETAESPSPGSPPPTAPPPTTTRPGPLEVLVEREIGAALAAGAARRLDPPAELLAAAGLTGHLGALAAAHPLPPPHAAEDASDACLRLLAGPDAADGVAAARRWTDAAALPADLVAAFLAWLDGVTARNERATAG